MHRLLETAVGHVADIVALAIVHDHAVPTLIVSDDQCELALVLASAYRTVLPAAKCILFEEGAHAAVMNEFDSLPAGALVVLIQSTSFRLEAYRIRIELFRRGLKVIEHPHLSRMQGAEVQTYVEALAYDASYLRGTGVKLKAMIDTASRATVVSAGHQLTFAAGLEPAKLNVGDYTGMVNVGGQFPIGEVFTESRDLECVNGSVAIFVFGDTQFSVNAPDKPITLVIEKGKVVNVVNSTDEFDRVLEQIRNDEGQVWLRELGFGLNRAMTRDRRVRDIGTYERMCGVHLSLGAKHGVYKKPIINHKEARYHVDVFAVVDQVWLDDQQVFAGDRWVVA
jgi:aminopeptidase